MNRRNFINNLIVAGASFTILPGAGRIWRATREQVLHVFVDIRGRVLKPNANCNIYLMEPIGQVVGCGSEHGMGFAMIKLDEKYTHLINTQMNCTSIMVGSVS